MVKHAIYLMDFLKGGGDGRLLVIEIDLADLVKANNTEVFQYFNGFF